VALHDRLYHRIQTVLNDTVTDLGVLPKPGVGIADVEDDPLALLEFSPGTRSSSASSHVHVSSRATRRLRRSSADLREGPREEVGRDGTLSAIPRVSQPTGH